MGFVALITGHVASGKSLMAKRLHEQLADPATILDGYTLDSIVLGPCCKRAGYDSDAACQALSEQLSDTPEGQHAIAEKLKAIASKAADLPAPSNIMPGALDEAHLQALDALYEVVFAAISQSTKRNFIITKTLYQDNPHHTAFIEHAAQACGAARGFYGFSMLPEPALIMQQLNSPHRAALGKPTDTNLLQQEMATHTLIKDSRFRAFDLVDNNYNIPAWHAMQHMGPSLEKEVNPRVCQNISSFDTAYCHAINFSDRGLDALEKRYKSKPALSTFITDFLDENPTTNSVRMLLNHPELTAWNKDGSALIMPNYPLLDRSKLLEDPKSYKDFSDGLSLVAWFIHPAHLEGTKFQDPSYRESRAAHTPPYTYSAGLDRQTELRSNNYDNGKRSALQPTIADIERRSDAPYLHSILALTPNDLPWLKDLKQTTLKHLHESYGITDNDHVEMYFNTIINKNNVPLHMHIKVNYERHPALRLKSIGLEEIIEGLENGKTGRQMLLERTYYSPNNEVPSMLKDISGITVRRAPSPLIVRDPLSSGVAVAPRSDDGCTRS